LIRKQEDPNGVEYRHLKIIVKAAFNQRRKTLRNALRAAGLDITQVDESFLTRRAEQLTPEAFSILARSIPTSR
jgi:16S rRNA (adenine1518-N6/adenine1519-N6)-dimethyltransferase